MNACRLTTKTMSVEIRRKVYQQASDDCTSRNRSPSIGRRNLRNRLDSAETEERKTWSERFWPTRIIQDSWYSIRENILSINSDHLLVLSRSITSYYAICLADAFVKTQISIIGRHTYLPMEVSNYACTIMATSLCIYFNFNRRRVIHLQTLTISRRRTKYSCRFLSTLAQKLCLWLPPKSKKWLLTTPNCTVPYFPGT